MRSTLRQPGSIPAAGKHFPRGDRVVLARAGFLASFGSGGLPVVRIGQALSHLEREVGDLGYAVNLPHTPSEPATERAGRLIDAAEQLIGAHQAHQLRWILSID